MGCSGGRAAGRAVAAVMGGSLLAGCATGAGAGQAGPTGTQVTPARPPALSDTRLRALLLTAGDLGEDYDRHSRGRAADGLSTPPVATGGPGCQWRVEDCPA